MPPNDCILRPVEESDIEEVLYLVGTIGDGLTSLPSDPDFITHRINDSLRAFDPRINKPGGESYLFVLEDQKTSRIVGTSGILSRVGGFDPFYTYEVLTEKQAYEPLGIAMELESLHLRKNHKGPTELCSLFLHKDYRSGGLGKLLSLSRFLFMKTFQDRFDEVILAELRGYIDDKGESPFWEAVGKQFFANDYYTADILSGLGEKDFIEALMPEYPIYITLLPESARKVIGQVHRHTEPAQKILKQEGFNKTNEVDIFDAGPIYSAQRDNLQTWKKATGATIALADDSTACTSPVLLANCSLEFRALITTASIGDSGELSVSASTMDLLGLKPGNDVMYLNLATQ